MTSKTANLELPRLGGFVPFQLGQLLTDEDMQRAQRISGLQTFFHWMMALNYDLDNEVPLQGFPEDGDHCKVTATGDLTATVEPGLGLVFSIASIDPAGDAWGHDAYQPLVLEGTEEIVFGAHHVTHPRIDLVVIEPAMLEDQEFVRRVKNPENGLQSAPTLPLRARFTATVSVIPGAASASPVEPAIPTGKLLLARAEVPGGSGAVVIRDARPILQLGSLLKGHPHKEHTSDFVPGPITSPDALLVGATSPTSMKCLVREGRAVINGISRFYPRQTLAVTAADPTNGRIDLVVAKSDGTVAVVAGAPAGSPSAPSAPAKSVALAQISVPAAVATLAAGRFTDLRADARRPIGNSQVNTHSLNHDRLSTPEVYVELGTPVETSRKVEIPIELFYPDGETEYDGPFGQHECAFEVALRYKVTTADSMAAWPGVAGDFAAPTRTGFHDIDMNFTQTGVGNFGVPIVATWFRPDTGNAEDVNSDGQPGVSGRHVFWMEERTGTLVIELAPTAGSFDLLVMVRPMNRPGGARRRLVTLAP